MGLFICRRLRRRLEARLPAAGGLALSDAEAARSFAFALGEVEPGAEPLSPGRLHALALLAELLRALVAILEEEPGRGLLDRLLEALEERLGGAVVERVLRDFEREFSPPLEDSEAGPGAASRRALLAELLVFWLLESNPAAGDLTRVLHGEEWSGRSDFAGLTAAMSEVLAAEAAPRPEDGSVLDLLLAPSRSSPGSLGDQLRFLRAGGRRALGPEQERQVVGALDLLAEEERPRFPPGPGPSPEPQPLGGPELAERRFSPDREWMPGLVLQAKSTFVWLDQLSREHGRPIRRLDEIPETALATLARRGVNGLWLIGLWQRSAASARIKRLCGNPQATASAYSIFDYRIADELGGEPALEVLERRAAAHGIRLAADMVPNHMGIDSRWVLEHPERFLGTRTCPFPSYRFRGPDLSSDPEVGIFLEDHYYDRSDAAVVFKRVDRRRGEERYIYHGNDGTSTPWNDTAQLDYLRAEVREAVLETVLELARRFSVIRFDAAMTLARKHFQRLWFPRPGDAGAIPSRAGHGVSDEEFERRMPGEFWRQVVDRLAVERPGTMLVAEAFWLMEGYFVRTLGMHRVYNSAFMNLLRDGETAKFRRLIRQTLAFDPAILERYVNFMSNPDERSAVEQFGRGDRYFGVCTLLATLPGTPMFAHGQFEGLSERYGMEYSRALSGERPDPEVVARHRREIAPLLARRELFAGAPGFRLYDFVRPDRSVDEDVLAFSNGLRDERLLVVFNNRAASTRGRVARSVPYRPGGGGDGEAPIRQPLAEALGVGLGRGDLVRFRDLVGERDYLQEVSGTRGAAGIELELGPWAYRVLGGFRRVEDDADGSWTRLARQLGRRGVPDLDARREAALRPDVSGDAGRMLPSEVIGELLEVARSRPPYPADDGLLHRLGSALADLEGPRPAADERRLPSLLAFLTVPVLAETLARSPQPNRREAGRGLRDALAAGPERWALGVYRLALGIGGRSPEAGSAELTRELGELRLERPGALLAEALAAAVRLDWGSRPRRPPPAAALLAELRADPGLRAAVTADGASGGPLDTERLAAVLETRLWLEIEAWSAARDVSARKLPAMATAWWRAVAAALRSAAPADPPSESSESSG